MYGEGRRVVADRHTSSSLVSRGLLLVTRGAIVYDDEDIEYAGRREDIVILLYRNPPAAAVDFLPKTVTTHGNQFIPCRRLKGLYIEGHKKKKYVYIRTHTHTHI